MTNISPREDVKTPKSDGFRGFPRLLALMRNTWRTLTSMGTALVLLFLLALGAIPGALLPQRSLNESKVEQYIGEHPT
ncbi:MAG: cytochrome c biogenesis protein ResB, partial [Mycobacterium sp.]